MNKIIAWLGRQVLFQTFDKDVGCDVDEILGLMDDAELSNNEEADIVNVMDSSKTDRKFVVLAYPKLSESDFQWVQSIRQAHDPQFTMVGPHITLVFPFNEERLSQDELFLHVDATMQQAKRIKFVIESARVELNNSDFQVHLVLGPGTQEVMGIHDSLYGGALASELRTDIPYVPHITVASGINKAAIHTLAESLNNEGMHVTGTVDRITIGLFDDKKVRDLTSFDL